MSVVLLFSALISDVMNLARITNSEYYIILVYDLALKISSESYPNINTLNMMIQTVVVRFCIFVCTVDYVLACLLLLGKLCRITIGFSQVF